MRGRISFSRDCVGNGLPPRIIPDEFVQGVLSEMNDLGKENLRLRSERRELPSLAEKVCEIHQVSLDEMRYGSRRQKIVEARRVFFWLAAKKLWY